MTKPFARTRRNSSTVALNVDVQSAQILGGVTVLPDADVQTSYEALVGLDEIKRQILDEASLLLDPGKAAEWSNRHHGGEVAAVRDLQERSAVVILAGDVGTGKTALGESIGDAIARQRESPVLRCRLSLGVRGSGAVGELSKLLTTAFASVQQLSARTTGGGESGCPVVFVIDEADALAQSRELEFMHHEDRVGVNAMIRGIDDLSRRRLPILTVLCTNRLSAIDPAIRRRAAAIFELARPDQQQRAAMLTTALAGCAVSTADIELAARRTGPTEAREFGATYSDLRQRLIATVLKEAIGNDEPLTGRRLVDHASALVPTRPFVGES